MGADKEAKRPAGCTLDDRWRIAPFPPGREGRGDGWRARNAPSLPLELLLLLKSKTNSACNALQGPQTKTLPPPLAYLLNASPAVCALPCRLFWARRWCPRFLISRVFCCRCSAVAYLFSAVLQSTTRGMCRALFCHLAVGQPLMPSCLGCLVVLLAWCRTAAGFGCGGGATLRGVPRLKNSHGRRPSIHGEGEPPKVGEPRRGAPVADRFAAFRFAQAVCFPQFWPFQLLENYF